MMKFIILYLERHFSVEVNTAQWHSWFRFNTSMAVAALKKCIGFVQMVNMPSSTRALNSVQWPEVLYPENTGKKENMARCTVQMPKHAQV